MGQESGHVHPKHDEDYRKAKHGIDSAVFVENPAYLGTNHDGLLFFLCLRHDDLRPLRLLSTTSGRPRRREGKTSGGGRADGRTGTCLHGNHLPFDRSLVDGAEGKLCDGNVLEYQMKIYSSLFEKLPDMSRDLLSLRQQLGRVVPGEAAPRQDVYACF